MLLKLLFRLGRCLWQPALRRPSHKSCCQRFGFITKLAFSPVSFAYATVKAPIVYDMTTRFQQPAAMLPCFLTSCSRAHVKANPAN